MKAAREIAKLRARLADAEETLRGIRTAELPCSTCMWGDNAVVRAIRTGEVDAVVVTDKAGPQVFTLEGADHAYRILIESMNEGALTLTPGKVILYANQCFARMVKAPLAQVMGGSLRRYLSPADQAALQPLLKQAGQSGAKLRVSLRAADGSEIPVQLSAQLLAPVGSNRATISLVVTDLTAAQRHEELLRALTHRVVQAQETERNHVAIELHDNITQPLCAVLSRSQALVNRLLPRDGPAKSEALKLHTLLGQVAEEVEHISRNLRPSVLEHLGLPAVLRATEAEFVQRTGVPIKLICRKLTARLPHDIELAIFRILQEALRNVERHAHARHVTVGLWQQRNSVQLTIRDDGIGFALDRRMAKRNGKAHLGLLSMRERATYVGGELKVKSARRAGTEIELRIPLTR